MCLYDHLIEATKKLFGEPKSFKWLLPDKSGQAEELGFPTSRDGRTSDQLINPDYVGTLPLGLKNGSDFRRRFP